MKNIYNYVLNLLFPKKCINCKRENSYLCEDCLSLIELNQIHYCTCPQNPNKNHLRCDKCSNLIFNVYTIFNEKQKLSQKLFLKSKTLPELNTYLAYLIITQIKNITILNLENNFALNFENEEMKKLTECLSEFTKIPIRKNAKNILLIAKKYPSKDIFEKIEKIKAEKIYVITLFRKISLSS